MDFQHVLIATDLSEESKKIVKFAETLLKHNEKVTLVSIAEVWPAPQSVEEPTIGYGRELMQQLTTELQAVAKEHFKTQQTEIKVIASLNPAKEICHLAKELKVDVIIIGSHGAGALANLFIGSTVQRVVKLAECPVLVVPRGVS